MKSIPRRNSRCSHSEWFAWCICTLLFTERKMYCMQQQQQKHALRTITQRDSLWISLGKKCARVKARQSRKKMGSQKRGEKKERANGIAQQNWTENQMRPCVDCAESFHAIFSYDWELAIEIRELIPINFIAPVRLFSRYTMAKWGNEWTDSDLYICFRRDTSCSGLRSLHSKNHHSSFFFWFAAAPNVVSKLKP